VIARGHLEQSIQMAPGSMRIGDIAQSLPVVAYPDEPLRAVVHRMAQTGMTASRSWSAARNAHSSA